MTTYECFIDPGRSSGIVWYHYSDTEPWTRDGYAQVTGGLTGLLMWLDQWGRHDSGPSPVATFYAEKFRPYSFGSAQTLDSTYPLVVEGGLITLDLLPEYDADPSRWQFSDKQYWTSGKNVQEKRKKQKAFLRDHGLHLTAGDLGGKVEGHKDAEDVTSATFHALNRMRLMGHEPTLREYFGGAG